MAEFCLQCFKRFEPNANEYNTTLSTNLEWCEGCAELRQVVVDFVDFNDDDNEPMTECKHQDDKCEYWYMGMCELDDRLNVCPHSELYKQLQKFSGRIKNKGNKQVMIRDNLTLYCHPKQVFSKHLYAPEDVEEDFRFDRAHEEAQALEEFEKQNYKFQNYCPNCGCKMIGYKVHKVGE